MRQFGLDDFTGIVSQPDVRARPAFRVVLKEKVEFASLERFQRDGRILVVLVSDAVEVVHAAPDRQILRPVVRVSDVVDEFAAIVAIDDVGTRSDGFDIIELVERLVAGPVRREYRYLTNDHVQFTVALAELESHRQTVQHLG